MLRGGFDSHPFCTIHTSARLLSYSYSVDSDTESPLTLKFSDGSTAAADVLIGADGIHSVVRATMFWGLSHGDDLPRQQPKWTGTVAYRSLIERKTLDGIWKDHRALTLPMMASLLSYIPIGLFIDITCHFSIVVRIRYDLLYNRYPYLTQEFVVLACCHLSDLAGHVGQLRRILYHSGRRGDDIHGEVGARCSS